MEMIIENNTYLDSVWNANFGHMYTYDADKDEYLLSKVKEFLDKIDYDNLSIGEINLDYCDGGISASVEVKDNLCDMSWWMDIWTRDDDEFCCDWNETIFSRINTIDMFRKKVREDSWFFDMCSDMTINSIIEFTKKPI